jgi:TPR repeat protein
LGLDLLRNIAIFVFSAAHVVPAFAQDALCEDAGSYLVQRYAQAGDAQAQFNLSQRLDQPHCSLAEQAKALELLHHAAFQNHPDASYLLGVRYIVGLGVSEDPALGLSYLVNAAEAGHLNAQFQFAMIRLETAHTSDHRDQALYWLGAAASQGDAKAALALGHIYAGGLHGITRETCWAMDWFDAAEMIAQDARVDLSDLLPTGLRCDL